MNAATTLAFAFRQQAAWCGRLGSPLYAHLCERLAGDALEGGPTARVLRGCEGDPPGSALALRLLGAVHRLALEGAAPALAVFYPSAGGDTGRGDPWPAFRAVLEDQEETVARGVRRPVQTNEVGRCAALLGGFLVVAATTGLPLALLEIGASGGLNLRWDRFRYDAGGVTWGDPVSACRIACAFSGPLPPRQRVQVAVRQGCDRHPIDAASAEGALTLQSYLWPDQSDRSALLRAAIEVSRRVPATVDAADAASWVARRLASPASGVATVVYHSIVWQYLSRDERAAVAETLRTAGARATPDTPLAWLRLEPAGPEGPYELRLMTWPGGRERRLAESSPHGRTVRWL